MRNKIGFKNVWKMYSHTKRFNKHTPTLQEFQNYMEFRSRSESQGITLPTENHSTVQNKSIEHWQVIVGVQKFTPETQSLLSEECRNFVANSDNQTIYNRMIQERWELARLVEMVQATNFRYEFLRQSLTIRNSTIVNQNQMDEILQFKNTRRQKIAEIANRIQQREVAKFSRREKLASTLNEIEAKINSIKGVK